MTKAWGYIGKLNSLSFFFILGPPLGCLSRQYADIIVSIILYNSEHMWTREVTVKVRTLEPCVDYHNRSMSLFET